MGSDMKFSWHWVMNMVGCGGQVDLLGPAGIGRRCDGMARAEAGHAVQGRGSMPMSPFMGIELGLGAKWRIDPWNRGQASQSILLRGVYLFHARRLPTRDAGLNCQ